MYRSRLLTPNRPLASSLTRGGCGGTPFKPTARDGASFRGTRTSGSAAIRSVVPQFGRSPRHSAEMGACVFCYLTGWSRIGSRPCRPWARVCLVLVCAYEATSRRCKGSPTAIELSQDGAPHEVMYRLSGTAREPKDAWADDGRGHPLHSGAEFVLTVREDLFHVHVDAQAYDIASGSKQAVEGRFAVIGAYEWEMFGLADTRADWYVEGMEKAPYGDTMLDLRRLS